MLATAVAGRGWVAAILLVFVLSAAACTEAITPTVSTTGAELPEEVAQLPAVFYEGTSAEPGAPFDLDKVRSVTADPLQAAVVADLDQTNAQKSPAAFYRYHGVQILGGSCSGLGPDQVCEIRVQRVYDVSDPAGVSQGARHDARLFRAKPFEGEWRLFDTNIDGRWLTEIAGGSAPPAGG